MFFRQKGFSITVGIGSNKYRSHDNKKKELRLIRYQIIKMYKSILVALTVFSRFLFLLLKFSKKRKIYWILSSFPCSLSVL